MRNEFNKLQEVLFIGNTYDSNGNDNWAEVHGLLVELGGKIDEAEKRMECAIRSSKEINETITKYTEEIDDELPIKMSVNDHDLIRNCSDDVRIALTLNDNMCVVDNWYNLFSTKEEPSPIKREVFMTFDSSWGEIDCDRDGNVIEIRGDEYIGDERSYLYDIAKFDLVEYGKFCESENFTMGEADDILFVGFWRKDGVYEKADEGRRNGLNVFGDEIAPTMLCIDEGKYVAVKDIILKLKVIDVDGETMEYILRQVGMEEQMLKQLFAQSTNDEIDYLHDVRNGKG